MITVNLSLVNLRIDKERSEAAGQMYLNTQPDFQREYEAWDDKLKTKLVETMLCGRAMNPIWTISNKDDKSDEILDGMHRIRTATDFFSNKFKLNGKYLSDEYKDEYSKKYFKDLTHDDQNRIRNYNFIFNPLDATYRTNINKRQDMYEILNRSSKTLNEFEFNKVLYNPFYNIISEYKKEFNKFLNKKDKRGNIEMEIIASFVLSEELPKSWSSINNMVDTYLKSKIGGTENQINKFLKDNTKEIKNRLDFICKIINRFIDEKLFSKDKREFNKFFLPYKFMIYRVCFKLKDISVFNRHINKIIYDFRNEILNIDIQTKLECTSRNAMFQKKLISLIDQIIDDNYDSKDVSNNRLFSKKMISKRLKGQDNKCCICSRDLTSISYEGDHIKKWCSGGKTEYSNLQVICKNCHRNKE